jgi:hypothetical protein
MVQEGSRQTGGRNNGSARWRLGLVVLVTLITATLVALHVRRINGQWYWVWEWRHVPTIRALAVGAAALPVLLGF